MTEEKIRIIFLYAIINLLGTYVGVVLVIIINKTYNYLNTLILLYNILKSINLNKCIFIFLKLYLLFILFN